MARSNKEFVLAWLSLSGDEETSGWQVISLPSSGSIEIQAGRCSLSNSEAVLFSFPTARLARSEKLPEGKGFFVEKAGFMKQDGYQLALTRQVEGDLGLFTSMVCDVVGVIDEATTAGASESELLRILVRRVHAWQQFMSRGSSPLGLEAELGLMGELHFMTVLLDSSIPPWDVLNSWVGPNDAPQDFLLGVGAIEVKATMSSSGFPVKIGSLEQLDDAIASPLFLAAVRFIRGEGGLTLPEMIAKIKLRFIKDAGAADFFCEQLIRAGYSDSHKSSYTRRFEPKFQLCFSISEGFPRITSGVIPLGITRALYEINLDHAREFIIDINVALKRLGVLS